MKRKTTKRAGLRGTPRQHAGESNFLLRNAEDATNKAIKADTCSKAWRRSKQASFYLGAATSESYWAEGDVRASLDDRIANVSARLADADQLVDKLCGCEGMSGLRGRKTAKRKRSR